MDEVLQGTAVFGGEHPPKITPLPCGKPTGWEAGGIPAISQLSNASGQEKLGNEVKEFCRRKV